MARPVTISDDDIIRAARDVFLERGIRGTTAEVASRAGVSEGAIFKRFKTKEQLFHRAMRSVDDVMWIAKLPERVGKGELREQLVEVGIEAIEFFRRVIPFHMMAWSNPDEAGVSASVDPSGEPPPMVSRKRVAAYFEAEKRAGRLGTVDADILARSFVGALYNFVAIELMFGHRDPAPMSPELFVRGFVHILLRGCEPDPTRDGYAPLKRGTRR